MRSSSHKDFSVYDFNDVDKASESESAKYSSMFHSRRPKIDESITDCVFLHADTSGLSSRQKNVNEVSSVLLHKQDSAQESYDVGTTEKNMDFVEEKSEFDEITESLSCHDPDNEAQDVMGAFSPVSDGTPGDVIFDEEMWKSGSLSPSTSASDLLDNEGLLERPDLIYTFGDMPLQNANDMAIVLSADYFIYEKIVYGESLLAFFPHCIKIECSGANGDDETYVLELAILDIIHIDCQWSVNGEVAIIKIYAGATSLESNERVSDDRDTVKLVFAVTDLQWLDKERKIKSLSERYRDVWNINPSDALLLEDDVLKPNLIYPKHYFNELVEPFEDIIYPKGDPDAVSISKRDIELLQPDTFINDTIIDFYIKYLKNKIEPSEKHRFHFFNSFFFRKLADLDKVRGNALEGREAFLRVRKWTRKVDIFEKDYIFIPVNFNLHWSLLVICHPGDIVTSRVIDTKSPKVPCILHMDSIKGTHIGLKAHIQSYLWEEWKERHPNSPEESSLVFLNLRFVPLELPQQENSFDCGLFLLHFVELFLEDPPACFNPFKISKFSSFLTTNWFSPAEASLKRVHIRTLIYNLLNEPSHEVNPTTCTNGNPSSESTESSLQEPVQEFLSGNCGATETVIDDLPCSVSDSRVDIEGLAVGVAQCDKQEGSTLQEVLPEGESFQKLDCISPIEEYAKATKQLVSSSADKDDARAQDSTQDKEAGIDSPVSKSNCSVFNPKEETEKDCGIVPESPILSYNEKLKTCVKDSPEIDTFKIDGRDGRDQIKDYCGIVPESPILSYNEKVKTCVEDCPEIDTSKIDDRDGRDHQIKDFSEINTDEVECGESNDLQKTITADAASSADCEVTHTPYSHDLGKMFKNESPLQKNDNDAQIMIMAKDERSADAASSADCEVNRTPYSHDLGAMFEDESPLPKNDNDAQIMMMAKDERSAGKEQQQSRKRRRVILPQGERRLTRNFTRNFLQ